MDILSKIGTGFKNAGSTAADGAKKNILGQVETAVLYIFKTKEGAAAGNSVTNEVANTQAVGALRNVTSGGAGAPEDIEGMDKFAVKVQYNPSSLSIGSDVKGMPLKALEQHIQQELNVMQNTMPPSTILQVDLIFDAVNNKNSFFSDAFRISPTDIAKLGMTAASKVATAKEGNTFYTVMTHIHGLLGAVMDIDTRLVVFQWANMRFAGEVSEMQASYDMFNPMGHPVRGKISMRIVQTLQKSVDGDYWDKAFDKCFGEKSVSAQSGGKKMAQEWSNLLNINW